MAKRPGPESARHPPPEGIAVGRRVKSAHSLSPKEVSGNRERVGGDGAGWSSGLEADHERMRAVEGEPAARSHANAALRMLKPAIRSYAA